MTTLPVTLAEIALPVSAAILLLALLRPLARRRYAARLRCWAWLLLAVRLLVPVHFALPAGLRLPQVVLAVPQVAVYDEVTVDAAAQRAPETDAYIAAHAALLHRVQVSADGVAQKPQGNAAAVQPGALHTGAEEALTAQSGVSNLDAPGVLAAKDNAEDGAAASRAGEIAQVLEAAVGQAEKGAGATAQGQNADDAAGAAAVRVETKLTLAQLAAWVWVLGAAGLAAFSAVSYGLARRRLLRATHRDETAEACAARIAEAIGLGRCPPVLRAPAVQGPLLLGAVRPLVLLPTERYTQENLTMILHHELTHAKRHDIAFKLLLQLVCCVHWYNPLVWVMAHLAGRDLEISCDDAVMCGQNEVFRSRYAESILQVLQNRAGRAIPGSTAFGGSKETLRQRITNIFDATKKRGGLALLAVVLAVCVAATSLVACTGTPTSGASGAAASSAESAGAPPESEPEVPEIAMLVMELYENYCNPQYTQLTNGTAYYDTATNLARGFLEYTDQLGPYALDGEAQRSGVDGAGESYCSYAMDNRPLTEFFFEPLSGEYFPRGWQSSTTQNAAKTWRIPLTVRSAQTAENGDLVVLCERSVDGPAGAVDVRYTLRPHTAEAILPELASYLAPGDTYYTLIQVDNVLSERTEGEAVELRTAEDVQKMADAVNSNPAHLKNTYLLMNDIDLTGVAFTPIGSTPYPFMGADESEYLPRGFNGVFDGQGHTITGLTLVRDTKEVNGGQGFFCYIGPQGTVKNLTLADASVTTAWGPRQMWDITSGILAASCSGTVENCHVSGTVEGGPQVGGLIGYLSYASYNPLGTSEDLPAVRGCSADVSVRGTNEVGALFGSVLTARVENCTATGTLRALVGPQEAYSMQMPAYVGGFSGMLLASEVSDCAVDVAISYEKFGTAIGAFVGDSTGSKVARCTYNAAKTGKLDPIDTSNLYQFEESADYDVKAQT